MKTNRKIERAWDEAETPRARGDRFDFMAGFQAVFFLTLQQLLHHLLIFRDDISGAAAARALTTWDLNHRAGPSRKIGMAPRPSFSSTGTLPVRFSRSGLEDGYLALCRHCKTAQARVPVGHSGAHENIFKFR